MQHILKVPKTVNAQIDNGNMRSHTQSDFGSLSPNGATTNNYDVGRGNAGYTSEQNSSTPSGPFQMLSSNLNNHASCDFTHRHETRETTSGWLDRLITYSHHTPFHQ